MNLQLPENDNRAKMILGYAFGFSVLGVYFVLALAISFGKVYKESSFGFDLVMNALGPLGGMFCGWAFGLGQASK